MFKRSSFNLISQPLRTPLGGVGEACKFLTLAHLKPL
jgi:hypothetical protein